MNYLISYPRSGNTFMRYIIEFMSGMKSLDLMAEESNQHISREQSPLLHPNAQTIIGKRHDWNTVTEDDSVIFVLRNYKEAFIRNNIGKRVLTTQLFKKANDGSDGGYIGLLKRYDEFTGKKMLIYYEDLINPEAYISEERDMLQDIADFLQVEVDSKTFVENYQMHKNKSLTFYPKSQSKGKNKDYHVKKFQNYSMLKEWKQYLLDNYSNLYEKYLSEYD